MKKLINEFKAFVNRGSVLDLAVGMIIGAAFTAIITAVVNGILKPLINLIPLSDTGLQTVLRPAVLDESGEVLTEALILDWGSVISAIITFFLTALVLFIIIKIVNKAKEEANVNAKMKAKCEEKMKKGEALNDVEKKWVALMQKKHPEMVPALPEEPLAPAPEAPSKTEVLLGEILAELKANNK